MFTRIFLTIDNTKKATIGEISIMPIGGINFLNGAKKNSLNAFIDLKGSLYQLIFGTHVNNIDINNIKKIKSNILAIATVKPIFTPILIILQEYLQRF